MHPWELQLLQLTTGLRVWLLGSLADDDLAYELPGNPSIGALDRGGGFSMPIFAQFATYRESILIVMAKIDVYLRSMGRHRSEQWKDWLG